MLMKHTEKRTEEKVCNPNEFFVRYTSSFFCYTSYAVRMYIRKLFMAKANMLLIIFLGLI